MMRAWMGEGGEPRFTAWLHGLIDQGADRLTDRDLAILRDAQRCDAPF